MDPAKIKAALDAIEKGDEAAALALLKELIAGAAGAGGEPAPEGEALAETPEPDPAAEEEKAALAALKLLTGKSSAGEAVEFLTTLHARVTVLDGERAALELSSRRELIADLVKLGVEVPATAWEGEPEKRTPSKRLAAEPIAELRARVQLLSKAKPRGREPVAPPPGDDGVIKLSKVEQEYCKKHDLTPEQFAAKKAGSVRKAK